MKSTYEKRWGHSRTRIATQPRKHQRQLEAQARQEEYDKMTPSEQRDQRIINRKLYYKKQMADAILLATGFVPTEFRVEL